MAASVRVTGIRADGRHGVLDWERDRAQPFLVDVEIEVDAVGDDLTSTADYRQVAEVVRSVVAGESYRLIETLAQRVADVVAGMPGVRSSSVTVHKPQAAAALEVADVSARAEA